MEPFIKKIAYVAGKSGGHIIPCITLMKQHYDDYHPLFFTTDNLLDHSIIQKQAPHADHIALPLGFSYNNIWFAFPGLIWHVLVSFFTCITVFYKQKPERVITTGGLIAIPACFAAYCLRIPIDVYELNAIPGKASKLISIFATHMYVCFEQTRSYFNPSYTTVVPYPVRYEYIAYDHNTTRSYYNLKTDIPTILILGGSQGSISLNKLVQQTLKHRSCPIQVIHQTGSTDTIDWKTWYAKNNIHAHVFAYESNLAPLLATADVIICRAGAGTLFEVVFFKKPCITIPLEGLGDNHQLKNAYAMQQQYNQCVVLRQSECEQNIHILIKNIEQFFSVSS